MMGKSQSIVCTFKLDGPSCINPCESMELAVDRDKSSGLVVTNSKWSFHDKETKLERRLEPINHKNVTSTIFRRIKPWDLLVQTRTGHSISKFFTRKAYTSRYRDGLRTSNSLPILVWKAGVTVSGNGRIICACFICRQNS